MYKLIKVINLNFVSFQNFKNKLGIFKEKLGREGYLMKQKVL